LISALIERAALLWVLASLATFAASLLGALLQPLLRRGATAEPQPPCSLILPVKLVNPGFQRAQASAFVQDYPTYEVVIGAMEAESPALDILRPLALASLVLSRFVQSVPTGAASPKLENLSAPLTSASYDVVATKDSNITFAPDTLRQLVGALKPGVGLVCAVPVAVRPETFAGCIEAVLINRDARLLLTAAAVGKGYGVGKAMVFRRGDLVRAGGLDAIGYTVAEDTALCRAMGKLGLRTVFARHTVEQEIGARTLRDVYARQARWATIRRKEEPLTFAFEPIACALPASFAAAVAAPMFHASPVTGFAMIFGGWYALEWLTAFAKGWETRPWTPFAFLGRDLILLAAWAHAWRTREVTWAGRKRDVRAGA
jgi:ceramide glucosyltransferase